MTWSIIARDKTTGHFGIAVATKFFAVGARVPFIAAGIGAVATQALVNPFYGTNGIKMLRDGMPADAVVKALIAGDAGRDHRQLHIIDAHSRIAAHTGTACVDWCGQIQGVGFSVAGNMLAGPRVLDDTAKAYVAHASSLFPRRLIYGEEDWSDIDLRVDDHAEPLDELDRLERMSRERWMSFRCCLPSKRNPVGITDRALIEIEIVRLLTAMSGQ
jgi:uncharacterized Ntn-hydrolase superfamily protein